MLLQKINKRQGIFNNILRSEDIGNLHSLKFDFSQQDQMWRISPRNKEFGRIGWILLLVLGISILIYMAIFTLRSPV
jgi:aromatic ring-cleaving dioxygenase